MTDLILGSGKGSGKSSGEEPPKIEFPCRYPVKVLGVAGDDFKARVFRVMKRHAPELQESDVSSKKSREERFCSLTFTIEATGKPQLEALFQELKEIDAVKMVL